MKQFRLSAHDAEAWTWQKRVSGECPAESACSDISVSVDGREVRVEREGERFSALVPLQEGKNTVVAVCRAADGSECGAESVTFTQRLTARPVARITLSLGANDLTVSGAESRPSEATGAPIVEYHWAAGEGNPAALKMPSSTGGQPFTVGLPHADGEYYFALRVVDANGREDRAAAYFVVEQGVPRLPDLATENAAWIERAVIYGAMPLYFGQPPFQALIRKLDDLRDLGVDAIWLCPCNVTPTGGHGYGVSDHFHIREDFGSEDDFRLLIEEAHKRGLRVLMDFVPNHSSIHHRYMQDALARGAESPYWDFYDRDDNGGYTHYFNWRHLPNLNYDNPEVRNWMTEAHAYWVREFDIDGYRIDAIWGVRQRRPDFAPELRQELKRIKPDCLLIAEAGARDDYYFTHGYDAAYDWTDELGRWAWEHVFEDPEQIVPRLDRALTNEGRGFHPDALAFRFLNNNDTGPRFITRYGPDLTPVAAALLLTLPGLPCIYTGQEVGAEYEPYRTSGEISWEDAHGLREHYKRLIALRKSTPALHSRRWDIVPVQSNRQVYAYCRYADGAEPVLVVLNFSPQAATAELSLPLPARRFADAAKLTDLLSGESVSATVTADGLQIALPPFGAVVLVTR